jgi:small subunit ribosomal protein S13
MFKLFGTVIQPNITVTKSLSLVYGIGNSKAHEICWALGMNPNSLASEISKENQGNIQQLLKTQNISPSEIKKVKRDCVARLMGNRSYRGIRHKNSFPVRGQRTSTNAKTQKRIGFKHTKI